MSRQRERESGAAFYLDSWCTKKQPHYVTSVELGSHVDGAAARMVPHSVHIGVRVLEEEPHESKVAVADREVESHLAAPELQAAIVLMKVAAVVEELKDACRCGLGASGIEQCRGSHCDVVGLRRRGVLVDEVDERLSRFVLLADLFL